MRRTLKTLATLAWIALALWWLAGCTDSPTQPEDEVVGDSTAVRCGLTPDGIPFCFDPHEPPVGNP